MLQEKIKKIQTALKQQKLKGLIIGNFGFNIFDDLLYYLLLKTPELALLYLPAAGKPTLYGIPFEVSQRQREYPNLRVQPFHQPVDALVKKHIRKKSVVGLRFSNFPLGAYQKLKTIKDARYRQFELSEYIMAVKLPRELQRLKQAARITDDIFKKLTHHWRKFKTENQAASFILTRIAEAGMEAAFPPIVASGKNAADPHHQPKNKKIQNGFCVIDLGVRYQGYCSDMTRTIYVGRPSQSERALYQTVRATQQATLCQVRAGVTTAALDTFCRQQLGPRLAPEFIHGLGHGVGSQVHEWPSVSPSPNVTLQENMMITIEPGVYRPGKYGIRIEDDVLVTKNGPTVLNQSDKKLILV